MKMDEIPICPHCGEKVTEVKETREDTHKIELGEMRYMITHTIKNRHGGRDYDVWNNKWVESDKVFDDEGYRVGEYTWVKTNNGPTYTCAKCGGNINDYFDVMGLGGWFIPQRSTPLQRSEVKAQ